MRMLVFIVSLLMAFATQSVDYGGTPRGYDTVVERGHSDNLFAFMFGWMFFGSFVVYELFKSPSYTPVKEVVIFILIGIGIGFFWMKN